MLLSAGLAVAGITMVLVPGVAAPQAVRPAVATERHIALVMITMPGCSACQGWDEHVAPRYEAGGHAVLPLRQLDFRSPETTAFRAISATPTFILTDNGREVRRFASYGVVQAFAEALARALVKEGLEETATRINTILVGATEQSQKVD